VELVSIRVNFIQFLTMKLRVFCETWPIPSRRGGGLSDARSITSAAEQEGAELHVDVERRSYFDRQQFQPRST
jgi:hypothetical protein